MSQVGAGGAGIEYQVTGQGRPVVLMHGFPDSGRLWRHQVPALAGAGFQVLVPDLRGYGLSSKPDAVEAHSLPTLAGDVLAILADGPGPDPEPRAGRVTTRMGELAHD
jgi:pimeloyl-ACP methyl ester carboxylesterase